MKTPPEHNARILSGTDESLALLAQALRRGEVVGMPTETVYGLAGNAFDPQALARIFDAKERPTFDPLIVHVSPAVGGKNLADLARSGLVQDSALSALAQDRVNRLLEEFWPGPLTLVLPKAAGVPDLATSGLATVGVRMPRHPLARKLIDAAGVPLAAPSANRFGRISPTSAEHVRTELGDRIDFILDGGSCEIGLESTVISVAASGELTLLRPGGTPRGEIERVAGIALRVPSARPLGALAPQAAPGMLESHYAPAKPLRLLPSSLAELSDEALRAVFADAASPGVLLMTGNAGAAAERLRRILAQVPIIVSLSETGDLAEAARNLFSALRTLDESSASVLFAEPCQVPHGLGHAIADRLGRASATRSTG